MRLILIDAARGVAIILMVIFHFCFDLTMLGLANWDFYHDPFWLHARTLILTLFLILVGFSFTLSQGSGDYFKKYARRQCYLFICMSLISISTYFYSGERFIFFGVLHFIFAASLINLIFVRFFYINFLIGVIIIVMGNTITSQLFHNPFLKWIGFQIFKPETDDYVPLFPWYGVVLIGLFLGKLAMQYSSVSEFDKRIRNAHLIGIPAFMGRHSLLIYMIHQPILIALLSLSVWIAALI